MARPATAPRNKKPPAVIPAAKKLGVKLPALKALEGLDIAGQRDLLSAPLLAFGLKLLDSGLIDDEKKLDGTIRLFDVLQKYSLAQPKVEALDYLDMIKGDD